MILPNCIQMLFFGYLSLSFRVEGRKSNQKLLCSRTVYLINIHRTNESSIPFSRSATLFHPRFRFAKVCDKFLFNPSLQLFRATENPNLAFSRPHSHSNFWHNKYVLNKTNYLLFWLFDKSRLHYRQKAKRKIIILSNAPVLVQRHNT